MTHKYEAFIYTVFSDSEMCKNEMESQGLSAPYGNWSADGKLCVVDLADSNGAVCTMSPSKPSYATETFPNWPKLSWEEARQLISHEASSEGGSDGWHFPEVI